MKKMTSIKRYFGIAALLMAGACSEPYDKDPNENALPAVQEVLIRDTYQYNVPGSAALVAAEQNALYRSLAPGVKLHSFEHTRLLFNKLMDGDTFEQVSKDATTGKDLGNCAPTGTISYIEAGTKLDPIYTCFNPSDRFVTVIPGTLAAPKNFIKYHTDYKITADGVKDKQGNSLTGYEESFTTEDFELISVTNANGSAIFYGVANNPKYDFKVGANAVFLRLVFNGPVNKDAVVDALNAPGGATVTSGGVPVTEGAVSARFDFKKTDFTDPKYKTDADKLATKDPRVLFLYHPHYITTPSDKTGFTAGDYHLHIPASVMTDTGAVMGAAEHLSADIDIDFTVKPAT